jgi:hypothetical protein
MIIIPVTENSNDWHASTSSKVQTPAPGIIIQHVSEAKRFEKFEKCYQAARAGVNSFIKDSDVSTNAIAIENFRRDLDFAPL